MLNIFPIIAIIFSLAVILIILARHYHDILIIDVEKIPEERAKKIVALLNASVSE